MEVLNIITISCQHATKKRKKQKTFKLMLPRLSRTWTTKTHWRRFALTSPPLGKRGTKTWYKEDPLHPFNLICNSSLKLVSHDPDHANCLNSGVVHGCMYEAPSPCYSHFFVQGELSSNRVHVIPCLLTIFLFLHVVYP